MGRVSPTYVLQLSLIAGLAATGAVTPVRAQAPQGSVPLAGRPAEFTGAVGQFRVTASAEPRRLRAGEVLSYTLELTGEGNFPEITPPRLDQGRGFADDWQIMGKPDRRLGDGSLSFTYRLRPKHADVDRLPAYRFSYFHPSTRRFETIVAPSLAVEVDPEEVLQPEAFPEAITSEPAPGERRWDMIAALSAGSAVLVALLVWWVVSRIRRPARQGATSDPVFAVASPWRIADVISKAVPRQASHASLPAGPGDEGTDLASKSQAELLDLSRGEWGRLLGLRPGERTTPEIVAALMRRGLASDTLRIVEQKLTADDSERFAQRPPGSVDLTGSVE